MGFEGSYLWRVRQKVGTDALITAGVGIILLADDDHVWLGKRSAGGEWAYFGGSMELGQSATACMRAELQEETQLEADHYRMVGLQTDPAFMTYTYPNGDAVQIVNTLFEVRANGRIPVADAEHSELKIFPLNQLPSPLKIDAAYAFKLYEAFKATGEIQLG